MLLSLSKLLSGKIQVYSILLASFTLAALQNVTVDDAVITDALVYLPSSFEPYWHQGNNCTVCTAKADPSRAYNGTWHNSFFRPGGPSKEFDFTFTGSALYIFFITTNLPLNTSASIHTDVQFALDGVNVSRYTHDPSTSGSGEAYQYNVPVYVNESLVLGEHTVRAIAVEEENFEVVMLFDYLIYTTNTTDTPASVSSASTTATATATATLSPSVSGTATSSKPSIGVIAGGTVGGVLAIALAVTIIFCRRRSKKSADGDQAAVVAPFDISHEVVARTSLVRHRLSTSSYPNTSTGIVSELPSRTKRDDTSNADVPSLVSPVLPSTASPSIGAPSSNGQVPVHEQIEQLRDELACLRDLHYGSRDGVPSEAPPSYSPPSHVDP